MSQTFSNGGYTVTVRDDRSIKVQSGDWISKYSMAIYGDAHANWDRFKRKRGSEFIDLADPNRIDVGELLYHPDPLPGEPMTPPEDGNGGPEPPMQSCYAAQFLKWLNQRFLKTDWRVSGTGGGDLSLTVWTIQYATIGITKKNVNVETWFHALASGLTIGWPSEGFTMGGSFSTTQFPSAGTILRSPLRRSLGIDDFRHGIIVLEFGANFVYFVGGGSLSLLLFGMSAPILVLNEIAKFFRYGDLRSLQAAFQRGAPSGVALLAGNTLGIPGFSVAGRVGFMYDRRAWRR